MFLPGSFGIWQARGPLCRGRSSWPECCEAPSAAPSARLADGVCSAGNFVLLWEMSCRLTSSAFPNEKLLCASHKNSCSALLCQPVFPSLPFLCFLVCPLFYFLFFTASVLGALLLLVSHWPGSAVGGIVPFISPWHRVPGLASLLGPLSVTGFLPLAALGIQVV